LADSWKTLIPAFKQENVHVVPSIEHAVKFVHKIRQGVEGPVDTLVAGSLLLVGGLIEVAGLTKAALEM
jgi:folylpolyglutamate synthase